MINYEQNGGEMGSSSCKLLKDSLVVFIKIPTQASSKLNLGNLKCNNPKKLTTGSQFYL